jgi:hypothetical protein
MSLFPLYDCTLADARTMESLRAVTLPLVPRVGKDVCLDGRTSRVAKVEYELESRQRVRLGHLSRVIVYLEPAV